MYGFEKIARSVETKFEEIVTRPEVQKEILEIVEAEALPLVHEATRRRVKEYTLEYRSFFQDLVRNRVDDWIKQHQAEIQVMCNKATEEAMKDTTVFQEIAKAQFSRALNIMASEAVQRAVTKQEKKAAKKP